MDRKQFLSREGKTLYALDWQQVFNKQGRLAHALYNINMSSCLYPTKLHRKKITLGKHPKPARHEMYSI
jgi:hypothetical protein